MNKRHEGDHDDDIAVIDKMDFGCEHFPFYDNIHLTIPKDQQLVIHDHFKLTTDLFDFKMEFIFDESKPAKKFTGGFVFYNAIYSQQYPGYQPIKFDSNI